MFQIININSPEFSGIIFIERKEQIMNKYLVTIPYNYVQFGKLTCFIYAENSEEALELATNSSNRVDEDYDDDGTDDTNFAYDEMIVETEEENVVIPDPPPASPQNSNFIFPTPLESSPYSLIPEYFLADIQFL